MKAIKRQNYTTILFMFFCLLCLFVANTAAEGEKSEMRCGWVSNPTPSKASLHDSDAEWIIGVQGGYQAEGDWPEFGPKQWIETNVHYGYGCACMKVRVDA